MWVEIAVTKGGARLGGARQISAPLVVIDAGTRPKPLAITGAGDVPLLDSTSITELDELPEHLIILGGGYIGLEFGQMFRRFGSEVTIMPAASRVNPPHVWTGEPVLAPCLLDGRVLVPGRLVKFGPIGLDQPSEPLSDLINSAAPGARRQPRRPGRWAGSASGGRCAWRPSAPGWSPHANWAVPTYSRARNRTLWCPTRGTRHYLTWSGGV